MSLPHALLGLINYHPATGYDLKTRFKGSIHFFWNAALPQIYRTLNQMERQGWVKSIVEHQEGKPSRKVYQITKPGRDEFLRWLAEPAETPEPRLPMLVKVFFGNQQPREALAERIREWRTFHVKMLGQYEGEVPPAIDRHSSMPGLSEEVPFWALTVDYGKRYARMTIEWCDDALRNLEREQESEPAQPGRPPA
jgi:DNA-binding PadR family transcriptional regulator